MRIVINECTHCGIEYRWQASGSNTPGPYNDHEYCEECKEALVKALAAIPKKFAYKSIKTDEVSLDTILNWEKEIIEEHRIKMEKADLDGIVMFPLIRRVFANMYDTINKEYSCSGAVAGRHEFVGREYNYHYWPSKINEAVVSVTKRVNLITGEILEYKIAK